MHDMYNRVSDTNRITKQKLHNAAPALGRVSKKWKLNVR